MQGSQKIGAIAVTDLRYSYKMIRPYILTPLTLLFVDFVD